MDDDDPDMPFAAESRLNPQPTVDGLEDLMRAKADETPEENAKRHEELRRRVQVDLNREDAIVSNDLEDATLTEHMQERRSWLEKYSRDLSQLASPGVLGAEDASARRTMSDVVTRMQEDQMALRCALEELILHAQNIEKLAAGVKPHGYPATSPAPQDPLAQNLRHLAKQLNRSRSSIEAVVGNLDLASQNLTKARRSYETVTVGYRQRQDFFEKNSLLPEK
jgi:hypothetical protein